MSRGFATVCFWCALRAVVAQFFAPPRLAPAAPAAARVKPRSGGQTIARGG
jgi:hypothetical protein